METEPANQRSGPEGNVTRPQLYQSYAAEKIVSLFGSPGEAQSFCNGQWLIFPRTAICLANVGKGPKISFFENGSHFYWVADQPYHVNNIGTYWHIVPAQVVGSAGKERAIHLFASPPDSEKFLYLGELEPSHKAVAPSNENHGMVCFALRPALPSVLWIRFGGTQLGNLDFTPLDRALNSLRGSATVEDRLGVLRQ